MNSPETPYPTQEEDSQAAHWASSACKDKHILQSSRPSIQERGAWQERGAESNSSQGLDTAQHTKGSTPSFPAQTLSSPSPTSNKKRPGFPGQWQAGNEWNSPEAGSTRLFSRAGLSSSHLGEGCPVLSRLSHCSNHRVRTTDTQHHRAP